MRSRVVLLRGALLAGVAACDRGATTPSPFDPGPVVNGVRTAGSVTLLVVPTYFASSPSSPFTATDFRTRYFDTPSSTGSLTDYFAEVSSQRFKLSGIVTPWVRTNISVSAAASGSAGVEGVTAAHDHVIQALRAVDASTDFGQLDNDGPDGRPNSGDDDGVVDGGVMLITAEPGRHCGGVDGIWPHFAELRVRNVTDERFRVADRTPAGQAIAVKGFVIVPAVTCANVMQGISIAAHELMHLFFRVPDMYGIGAISETQIAGARFWRTGCWDLMAAGSGWGCGTGPAQEIEIPTHPNPWVKETVHWLRADTIGRVTDTTITLEAATDGGNSVRLLVMPGEYFELEYRQKDRYDRNIPASGLLIYHVKLGRAVTPPTCVASCTLPPLLVEADNNFGLLNTLDAGGNRGEIGDAFGLLGKTTFSATTQPAAVAANGAPTTLNIRDVIIDERARVARVRLSH